MFPDKKNNKWRLLFYQNIDVRYGTVVVSSQPEAASMKSKVREMWKSV